MPDVALARPLPTVIQSPDIPPRRSRVVSFSSTSESALSSNPHSDESWFHIPSSQDSYSSASSCPPLPKGARPASPQPARSIDFDTHSHAQPALPLKRSGTFSSWNLEWRGISKVIKWAVLGDKLDDQHGLSKSTSRRNRNARSRKYMSDYRAPVPQRSVEAPPDHGFSPYIRASPTSPLSPTTSAACIDITYEGRYSVSELDDGHSKRFPSDVHFLSRRLPYISDELRRNRSVEAARHVSHVRGPKDMSVLCAASDSGHVHPYEASLDMHDAFFSVDRSTTTLDAHDWSRSCRVAQSDIGHSSRAEYMPSSAFPSTLSLSYGHDRNYVGSGTKSGAFRSFRSTQSAIGIPISAANSDTPLNHHRRPRKLRKSLRAMSGQRGHAIQSGWGCPSSSARQGQFETVSWKTASMVLPAPPVPPKSHLRPPRKLKKRPSPALPPLPRTNSRDTSGDPPPVPPKSASILKNKREAGVAPVTGYHGSGVSFESPSTSTASSGSASADDELHSTRETPATSENLHEDGNVIHPVKRPSLLRTESNRRWTVAVADVPDDLFIEELERLRRMGLRAGDVHGNRHDNVTQPAYVSAAAGQAREERGVSVGRKADKCLGANQTGRTKTANTVLIQEVDTGDEMEWLGARRAILCCRELVRTERSYQGRLQELADGDVSDAVPALLIQYLPALIGASKVLSARFNEDMSASGVSGAFVNVSSTLERALVPWSGVVGEFFGGNSDSTTAAKRKRDTAIPGFITEEEMHTEFGAVKIRCMSMHGRDKTYMARSSSVRWFGGEAISTSPSSHWLFRPAFTQGFSDESNDGKDRSGFRKSLRRTDVKEKERKRKPPFRDLAILPTQRVGRYVLLYKELLKHTPVSSPTRGLVERAVDTAVCLARKCDRAQSNSSFIFHG